MKTRVILSIIVGMCSLINVNIASAAFSVECEAAQTRAKQQIEAEGVSWSLADNTGGYAAAVKSKRMYRIAIDAITGVCPPGAVAYYQGMYDKAALSACQFSASDTDCGTGQGSAKQITPGEAETAKSDQLAPTPSATGQCEIIVNQFDAKHQEEVEKLLAEMDANDQVDDQAFIKYEQGQVALSQAFAQAYRDLLKEGGVCANAGIAVATKHLKSAERAVASHSADLQEEIDTQEEIARLNAQYFQAPSAASSHSWENTISTIIKAASQQTQQPSAPSYRPRQSNNSAGGSGCGPDHPQHFCNCRC